MPRQHSTLTLAPALQQRLLLRLLPVLFVASALGALGHGFLTYFSTRDQIVDKQLRAISALAAAVAEPVWEQHYGSLLALLNGAIADSDFTSAEVHDPNGGMIASVSDAGRAASGSKPLRYPVVLARGQSSTVVGTLTLHVSLAHAGQDAWIGTLAWLAAGLIVATAMLTSIIAADRALIVPPFSNILAAIQQEGQSGSGCCIPGINAGVEFDRVVDAINTMRPRLEEEERKRRALTSHFDVAVTHMAQGLVLYSAEGQLLLINERCPALFGLPMGLLRPGMSLQTMMSVAVEHGIVMATDVEPLCRTWMEAAQRQEAIRYTIDLAQGRVLGACQEPVPGGGWVATYEDITDRRRSEAHIAHLAGHDALTGLPNRTCFNAHLDAAVAGLSRNLNFAVLCLDLDRFKEVNDTLGHAVGDVLLRAVAERLQACLRETDIVARLGGDEFAILQSGTTEPEAPTVLARRLIDIVEAPYNLDGHHVSIGVSVGIAQAPGDGSSAGTLLKNADLALYRAKSDGRGTFRYFEPEMDTRQQARHRLELDLRHAVANGEFELYYQPLISSETSRVVGFEALVRWQHPERGTVAPGDFIPLAEETGLILDIGKWVLQRACSDATGWPSEMRVSVNLSPLQFKRPGLTEAVRAALTDSGLAARQLELEITEAVLLKDSKAALTLLRELRDLGVRIAMDDFGTGYSSLSYLRQFSFDKIKIDRSFIQEIGIQAEASAIVRAVAALGSSFGVKATAEGVETSDQLAQVWLDGCTEAQGYLFSRPRPAAEIPALIEQLNAGASQGSTDTVVSCASAVS